MISLTPIHDPSDAEFAWKSLCSTHPHPFFLSWEWIGTLLECSKPLNNVSLLTIDSGGKPQAAALIMRSVERRRGVLSLKTLSLNAFSNSHPYHISPEYNGLLADPATASAAWDSLLKYLEQNDRNWDEFELEGIDPSMAIAWRNRRGRVREEQYTPSRFVDLSRVRQTSDGSCLGLLSSRVKSRIRSTSRGIQARLGPIRVEIAQSESEGQRYLSELKVLHEQRWSEHPSGGAFAHPFWERFHRQLIDRHLSSGVIQLSRVIAGAQTIGALYSFIYGGRVYFYQSGINYKTGSGNESPGLLVQALMIDHNAALGHDAYDFLAGDSQYKRSLATDAVDLWWGALQAPRLSLIAEAFARNSYRAIKLKIDVKAHK